MSDEPSGEDFDAIFRSKFHATKSVNERRKQEAKPMSTGTRRRAYKSETKTVQLNLRITPSLRSKIEAMAIERRCNLVDVFELAIEALEGSGQ